MTDPKLIIATPYQRGADGEMAAPFSLYYGEGAYPEPTVTLAISTNGSKPGTIKIARRDITLESFYELREAVNDLYDHIRQEQFTD